MKKPIVLVELNEINFDVVKNYVDREPGQFQNLQALFEKKMVRTVAENKYEENEPWIQWVSVHTGLTFAEHRVFRLGDIIKEKPPQIYEYLEGKGLRVGAISPMNTANVMLNPSYFIPDPWTLTPPDSSLWSRLVHRAVSQAVNDNSKSKISLTTALIIALSMLVCVSVKDYAYYFKKLIGSRSKPWMKALVFDLFLNDLHKYLFQKQKPDFSSLFLNAGAHIQHHYFFNAEPVIKTQSIKNPAWYLDPKFDPIRDMLIVYDAILKDYVSNRDIELMVVTALSQNPFDKEEFYYRLSEHSEFLDKLMVTYSSVQPRMTRDFLIEFSDKDKLNKSLTILRSVTIEHTDVPLFGEIEERDLSLFVTLTYPHEIRQSTKICFTGGCCSLLPHVVFVALKNGVHSGDGYAYFSEGLVKYAPKDGDHVKSLYNTIVKYYE